MPEAEDVITDAARHATVFAQRLWRRHRRGAGGELVDLPALLQRLDLLICAAFEQHYPLRIAQAPAPRTFARRLLRRREAPAPAAAIPATDGCAIWLPAPAPDVSAADALDRLRLMALRQAQRARRGSPQMLGAAETPLERAIYEVLEANAADHELRALFPGLGLRLDGSRRESLAERPALNRFPSARQPLELWVRDLMSRGTERTVDRSPASPSESLACARRLAARLDAGPHANAGSANCLFRDAWVGELRAASSRAAAQSEVAATEDGDSAPDRSRPRSARLVRRPKVRQADERDERANQGAAMVQTAQPHEHAEDPFGLQRPTDRDEKTAPEEFADSVAELAEARLVATPGAPREVLISDDPPETAARRRGDSSRRNAPLTYPEWDWRAGAYRDPGASVHLLEAPHGAGEWIARTLDEHRSMLQRVRRQFESLRARRVRLRQQTDGEEPDLEACIDAFADARAGAPLNPGLYQCTRSARRELAVLLLIDVSGSTDSWVSAHRRVIDVEREALLLVCLALEALGEPYSVLAFSGEGPEQVTVRSIKRFAERYSDEIALRVAGLEPERYTRAGAAIRHASALLMGEPARHRLLLILTDGKPNDVDEYDGRYGVEDMRQAVIEARLQGVFPFCLAIDRQAANYLPAVFGDGQYAVLHRPELLPSALVGWLRRLVHH
jgi:nitric oxide reductase NorD protein